MFEEAAAAQLDWGWIASLEELLNSFEKQIQELVYIELQEMNRFNNVESKDPIHN